MPHPIPRTMQYTMAVGLWRPPEQNYNREQKSTIATITEKRAKMQQWRVCFSFQNNNQPFLLSMTMRDNIDALGGYYHAFLGFQGTFLVRDDAWRYVEKFHKSGFFIAGILKKSLLFYNGYYSSKVNWLVTAYTIIYDFSKENRLHRHLGGWLFNGQTPALQIIIKICT